MKFRRNDRWIRVLAPVVCAALFVADRHAYAQPGPSDLLTPGDNFAVSDKIVSTSLFVWYTNFGGQLSGAWEPLGGRPSWTGEVPYWKEQIKQVMSANIDTINVHLYLTGATGAGAQRINLFQALSDLRHEGYDVPKVTPFLDPLITWGNTPVVDVATATGKDTFVDMYKAFYNQYYSVNTDIQADSYLTRIDDSTVLDTWHVSSSLLNISSLTRSDVETRLEAEFGAAHPLAFGASKSIYMTTTDTTSGGVTLGFADEQVSQFQVHAYEKEVDFNGIQTAQVKPGYWDQNIRTPGFHLPRDGGSHYTTAWQDVNNNSNLDRVYIESWNEYDESSGIYAAEGSQPPIISGPNPSSPGDDDWSSSDDPFEYIKTTAAGARQFNDTVDLDTSILWHDLPDTMQPGETINAQIIVRNTGDISWTGADNFKLGQNESIDPVIFGSSRYTIDDLTNDIPQYGGIFRGKPIVFDLSVTAPLTPGDYSTHWQMLQEGNVWFGEELAHTISVQAVTSINASWTNGTGNQDWFNSGNWSTPTVPGANDTAHINSAVLPAVVNAVTSVGRVVLDNNGMLDIASSGSLDIVAGLGLGEGQLVSGNSPASLNSHINIDGQLSVAKEFAIGNDQGVGTMTVGAAGVANANGPWLIAGHTHGADGTINIEGGTLNVAGFLALGWEGTGTLNVNGGLVDVAGVVNLGIKTATSVGDIVINAGEIISNGLNIGDNIGSGSLLMEDGSIYTNNGGIVQSPGSTITINGSAEFIFTVSSLADVTNFVFGNPDWIFSGVPSITGSLGSVIVSNAGPGDFDGDGNVDGHDFLLWQQGGSQDPFSAADLLAWEDNFGNPAAIAGTSASAAVPEPSTLFLLEIFGGIFGFSTRRR